MNLKTFSTQSRRILIKGVEQKLLYWGFDTKGNVLEQPISLEGGYLFRGEGYDDPSVPQKWSALKEAVQRKGIETVVEEAAYTWFNRIMAIRILSKNKYDQSQLEYEGDSNTPTILVKARRGQINFLNNQEKQRLQKVITNYSKEKESFTILLTGYCGQHQLLKSIFGRLDDYTELLLPDDILEKEGFIHLLNATDAISEEDYQKVELVGWLYQFYISERKDEIFASFKKNKKAEAKDIPAATQIFTPNWIVKYMVQNTVGKLWLVFNPDSELKAQMNYLVESESDGQKKTIIRNVEELTLIDPACGSGHILVEGFDLLYQIYMEEYYNPEEAVESIIKNNLFGLDIDDRATQLATFAILLKAAKVYPDVWKKGWFPQVFSMPESKDYSPQDLKDFLGAEGLNYFQELDDAFIIMKQAKNLGSIMKLKLSKQGREYITRRFEKLKTSPFRDFNVEVVFQGLQSYIPVLLMLTRKYSSVVANPPYMGSSNYNTDLKQYIDQNYKKSKADLYSVFFEVEFALCEEKGCLAQVTMQTWMFLKSFSKIRTEIIERKTILTLIDVGWNLFENHSYPTSVVCIQNEVHGKSKAKFYNLTKTKIDRFKENEFWKSENQFYLNQEKLKVLPENPIAYWASESLLEVFEKSDVMEDHYVIREGVKTGKNDQFIRYWFEIRQGDISIFKGNKYFPHSKGGGFRKWYGNTIDVLFFEDSGRILKNFKGSAVTGEENFFTPYITWSRITYNYTSFRFINSDFIPNMAGLPAYPKVQKNSLFLLGLGNSIVGKHILQLINPTLNFPPGLISKLPYVNSELFNDGFVNEIINQSKKDWNSREISWDFEKSPLLNGSPNLKCGYFVWENQVTKDFFDLHRREEELNRIFLQIYGLQAELNPEVALKDITILQEELDRKALERLEPVFREKGQGEIDLPIDRGEVIRRLNSYAIGVNMGRYRLDKPGLNIAHLDSTEEELASYIHNGFAVEIDEDGIIPLMGTACAFSDDAFQRVKYFLEVVWGKDTLTQNLNFLQECLDEDLESYLVKKFWANHCNVYKKKPIYWLFSSEKGAFQVLTYMHRMNAFTVEKIRSNYLMPHLQHLRSQIDRLESSREDPRLLDKFLKNLSECESYDLKLKEVADRQIVFDLDDGVTKNYALFEGVVRQVK